MKLNFFRKYRIYFLLIIDIFLIFLIYFFYIKFIKEENYITSVNIVAHPDDDLLFLSPKLIDDIENNKRVITIFLTSGDGGEGQNYWLSREEGVKSAYSFLASKKNQWVKKNFFYKKNQITRFVLKENKRIILVFLRLPDGGYKGDGFKNNKYQSLEKLWLGKIKYINSIDKSGDYSKESLISILHYLINFYRPNLINTQDFVGNFNDGDHSDHHATAYFAYAAEKKYTLSHLFVSYKDYEIKNLPKNVFDKKREKKKKAFLIYAQYDKGVFDLPYLDWIERQYVAKSIIKNVKKETLFPLFVDKNKIKEEKTKKEVVLKGVTTQFFGYNSYDEKTFWQRYEVVKKWGINLIGAFITPINYKEKLVLIDKLVDKTEEDKIYLYLTPTVDGKINNPTVYVNEFPKMIGFLSERYKDKKHILYGIWAEPSYELSEYLKLVNKSINSIRQSNNSIIIVGGINYGREFQSINDLKNYKNIILDYHVYPARDNQELKSIINSFKMYWDENQVNLYFPILIGEFGGVWEKDFGSEEDIIFIKKVLENINKNKFSYTAYTLDPYEGELSLMNENFNLTKKGEIIKNDLLNFPPTQF